MTSICGMALGTRPIPQENSVEFATANFLLPSGDKSDKGSSSETVVVDGPPTASVRSERVSICVLLVFLFSCIFLFLSFGDLTALKKRKKKHSRIIV